MPKKKLPPGVIGSKEWPGALKLMEEMGELTQVLAKEVLGPQELDKVHLIEEAGDVAAALKFFCEANGIKIEGRKRRKLERFRRWHNE